MITFSVLSSSDFSTSATPPTLPTVRMSSYIPPEVFPGAWIEDDPGVQLESTEAALKEAERDAVDRDHHAVDEDKPDPRPPLNNATTGAEPSQAMAADPHGPAFMDIDKDKHSPSPAEPEDKITQDPKDITAVSPPETRSTEKNPENHDSAMAIDDTEKTLDLLKAIPGLYRILDLISESSSGGLVDKIIISQDSFKELINAFSPGAYTSLTKVDFKALDKLSIKPLGLYGSKSEIISFLAARKVINEKIVQALSKSTEKSSSPQLRSGLYVLRHSISDANTVDAQQIFVIYWPEPTTWNDGAISSVRRNRVTFMRYLTKIADQVACLISPEHARSIVWNNETEDAMDIDEESDRLFTFEVAKTNEQEENVEVRPGFIIDTPNLAVEMHDECKLDPCALQPMLVHGETSQAIVLKHFVPGGVDNRPIQNERFFPTKLRDLLSTGAVRLGPELTDEAVEILADHGLGSRFPIFRAWQARNKLTKESIEAAGKKEEQEACERVKEDAPQLEPIIREAIVDRLVDLYPTVQRSVLSSVSDQELDVLRAEYTTGALASVHEKLKEEIEKATTAGNNVRLSTAFKDLKEKTLCIAAIFSEKPGLSASDREQLILHISKNGVDGLSAAFKNSDSSGEKKGFWGTVGSWFLPDEHSATEQRIRQCIRQLSAGQDVEFLAGLDDKLAEESLLHDLITRTVEAAHASLQGIVKKLLDRFAGRAILLQQEAAKRKLRSETTRKIEDQCKASRTRLFEEYEPYISDSQRSITVERVEPERRHGSGAATFYKISGCDQSLSKPVIQCKLCLISLTTDDQHTLQMDPTFVPMPQVQSASTQLFNIGLEYQITHAQLLESKKLLLIIEDSQMFYIYLESPVALNHAISRGGAGAKRQLHRDKLGKDVIFSYDEQKRMLSLCATHKGWGSALDLTPWYSGGTFVTQSCFISGCEEILFIDTSAQARIFSLVTQQFRPASLSLEHQPDNLHSSPDGACLLLSFRDGDRLSLRAYHWSTFGSTQGIDLGILDLLDAPTVLTSLVNRRNIHLIGIDAKANVCRSVILDITKKTTEFTFKETGAKGVSRSGTIDTVHNCLIDCHSDCWTRFPVVPAVQRRTVISSMDRKARKLLFITDRDHDKFEPYFSEMIRTFEQRTKKPTGDVLKNIQILALASHTSFFSEPLLDGQWDLSRFRVGEWLVDIVCLIPIQIAVTQENRFVPLKDGVISADLERSLLGAEVGQIVDAITFSLMESVFQSYMTSKPVKVVSSMGEQSVGKSFSLNHLVDTSFAGSAMRTTEGVWMSVMPTDDALLVALDFEGVHSIERSAQEDTLLVLFNTAISNLVLFRNNFAMSRSIAGLFQSFQSSSTVLDPTANPSLFRSVLVIIIKDVVESDKKEIVKEFSTKFQKIVEDEQDANFISRLHAGQLNIVPWPVIESRQFYSLFPSMKKLLDRQEVTHHTAGEFLHTLKTLMAKLKANDWGSLSQTLVAHRAQKLHGGLINALAFGLFELEPDNEPLKNFDTDELINKPDTLAQFFFSSEEDSRVSGREEALVVLQHSWDKFTCRSDCLEEEWIADLSKYLDQLVDLRIQRVYAWIHSNLSRFNTNHANIETLKRFFEVAIVELRANVELCCTQCAHCQLKCLLSRRHDSSMPHDCQTSHQCIHPCDFEEQGIVKTCGLPAGHPGQHICAVETHLCGEPCGLKDKQGCLGGCMKVARHTEDGHMCSARTHKCGEPCDLKNLRLPGGKSYSCTKTCSIPSDEEHTQHVCDSSACPVACELCKRLCSNMDHLHGLEASPVHLCGQTHNCTARCQAAGTCQIETAPQSVEATFTGKHETFQYTKYSQVAKRLPCVVPIPPGEKQHTGPHTHSTDPAQFHFCEAQCEGCGYYCTSPRGHPQQEHETSHGSMSKTRWAVDGPDGTVLELNGRKFGSDDDGAPMMCNLVCQEMGRHVHVDYCRADDAASCDAPETQHLTTRMTPNPTRAKDWISHSLFWRRTGFKDPYSRPDQANFARCDAMCPDVEHAGTATNPPHLSYCVLPLFHLPATQAAGLGYLSNDGHVFNCKNPSVMQQAFHVIFVIDRSGSMEGIDRRPLPNAPGTALILRSANNRLGAVYSALHAFWMSRNTALANNAGQGAGPVRRDAYSVVLFDHTVSVSIANDFTNTPDQLLNKLLAYHCGGGTNFTLAISTAEALMRQHWSTERTPVVIFLSDGECDIADQTVRSLSRAAVALGKPLSFHSVSFGSSAQSTVLRRMAQIALEIQTNAPRDPLTPAEATINSSYSEALDTVRLAETFLGFAESLRKPRGALFSMK